MAHVYLVKLFGMHKIGRTDNFERRMEQLKPALDYRQGLLDYFYALLQ